MAPGNGAQRCGIFQTGERYKLSNIAFIEAPRFLIGDVVEPFDFSISGGKSESPAYCSVASVRALLILTS
jgi:hypothetical protein